MEWIKVDGCCRCAVCGVELWGDENSSRKVTSYEAKVVYRLQMAYVDQLRAHGGGSRSAGRKRKDRQKFRPTIDGVQPGFRDYEIKFKQS